ncbi:MAG: HEAT repeat domain-containing protein, partial [Gemmatimonadota bacterium]
PAKPDARQVREVMEEDAPAASRSGIVRAEDFDTTLYFLDEKEIAFLKAEVEREYSQDLRRNILSMVLDVLELQPYPTVRAELISIIESFLPYLLGAGDFTSVAYILRECKVVLERARELLPEHRKALEDLPARLSHEETLAQLLQSLDEAHAHPEAEDLAELFGELRGEALPTLFAWLPRLTNARVREVLDVAVRGLATAHVNRVIEALGGQDPVMVGEAIALTGKLKLQQAVPALVNTLAHTERGVRQSAVQALADIGSPGALQGLERALEDADREVRLASVRILGQRRHRGALSRITLLVQGKSVREADLTEKMAFFEAYGAMVGEDGVAVLGAMLHSGGFLKKKEDPETRACAAMALGRIGSPSAVASLKKAADAKDAIVRNAINRALRGGTGPGA